MTFLVRSFRSIQSGANLEASHQSSAEFADSELVSTIRPRF